MHRTLLTLTSAVRWLCLGLEVILLTGVFQFVVLIEPFLEVFCSTSAGCGFGATFVHGKFFPQAFVSFMDYVPRSHSSHLHAVPALHKYLHHVIVMQNDFYIMLLRCVYFLPRTPLSSCCQQTGEGLVALEIQI